MKKVYLPLLSICFLCIACFLIEAKEEQKAPAGMEIIEIGEVKYIVPIGTEVRKAGGVVILEGQNEYMARKFIDIEQRLEKIEGELEEIRIVIDEIKKEASN